MPSKRKRPTPNVDNKNEEQEISTPVPSKKKKKAPYDPIDICQELYETIRNYKTEDGRLLCEAFIRAPKRRTAADYYDVVSTPIDLLKIQQKLKTDEYEELEQFAADIELMVNNTKAYYRKNSQEYKDACDLWEIFQTTRNELLSEAFGEPSPAPGLPPNTSVSSTPTATPNSCASVAAAAAAAVTAATAAAVAAAAAAAAPTPPTVATTPAPERRRSARKNNPNDGLQIQEEEEEDIKAEPPETPTHTGGPLSTEDAMEISQLYNAIITAKDGDRDVSEVFQRLPPRSYPKYYEIIKDPIDLKLISQRIQEGFYSSVSGLEKDLLLMIKNAKTFNEPRSQVYRDACRLQKIMLDKKKELEKFDVKKMDRGDTWEDNDQTPRSLKSRKSLPPSSSTELDKKKLMRRSNVGGGTENIITKRLWMLYKSVLEFCDGNGRYLREIFMTLPLKRDYPDYYRVIMEPIDMTTIENKIKCEKYVSELKLISEFELMFSNARHYNEEDSQVYTDADTLERVLKNKWKSMMAHPESAKKPPSKGKSRSKCVSPLCMKLQDLFDTIKDHADSRGRMLSAPFLKLPLKSEYPDYYEVIKRPIDMQRIQQRVASNQYESIDDMVADFVQMFDNACKYNEPDSLIYKDALTLQRVCLEKKLELSLDGVNEVPDVQAIVQELMTNLFISVYNYQDEEGRCYSDSFAELPERNPEEELEAGADKEKPLTFDQIKRNLNKGCYARVDRFQEDMFKVFERARQLSRIDSQLYEDAVEMQLFFIKIRDELCKNGEILLTPALSYTEKHLQSALEAEKREKLPKEQQDKDEEKKKEKDTDEKMASVVEAGQERSMKYRDQVYNIGDFVYVEPREKGLEAHVMCIEKLFHDNTGSPALHGNWFYRPNETFHLATRKFLEKEVFKSDFSTTIPLSQVMGPKCYVMFVKDYFKMKPEGFADKDVYVCESRYNARHKAFKKIKVWQVPPSDTVKLSPRDAVLSQVRVASVFADKTKESEKEDVDDCVYRLLDKTRENVETEVASNEYAGNKYFEQYNCASGCFKLGDCVYIKSTEEKPFIARIDKIWLTAEGNTFFYGPLFVRPSDVEHSPTRMFYCREVFYSCKETSFPVMTVIGRCAVLHIKDYCSYRITEVPDTDVYICESKYLENERSIRKLAKGLKKYSLSPKVTDDELYFFKKHIVPQKEPSPLLPEAVDMEDIEEEEKMDYPLVTTPNKNNLNVSYGETPLPEKSSKKDGTASARKSSSKSANNIRRQPSGYIVFAGEIRKQIQQENPDCSFGDISRIVGTKWRNLSKEEKERFEEKAKKIAEEQAAKQEAAEKAFNESLNNPQSPWSDYSRSMSPAAGPPGVNGQPGNYQTQFGFQQFPGVPHHPGQAGSVMVQQRGVPGMAMTPGHCNSVGGASGVPLTGVQQHMHHQPLQQVQQQHQQQQRSPYMSPYHQHPPSPHHHQHHHHPGMRYPGTQPPPPHHQQGGQHMAPPPQPRPPSPMFVSVPPRTQRLLHSEAYIRYIEGLSTSHKNVSDWNKTLTATPESTATPNEKRLPHHWIAQGTGYHGSVTNALWALRDLMLKDALNVSRTIPFEAL